MAIGTHGVLYLVNPTQSAEERCIFVRESSVEHTQISLKLSRIMMNQEAHGKEWCEAVSPGLWLLCDDIIFRRLACLKYLVLANMLMKSGINPFDSQEVQYFI